MIKTKDQKGELTQKEEEMSDLEMLADLNHVELSHVEEALRRDVRCMVLREVCEYMKRSPENSLRIRRLYHRHDNLRAAQIAAHSSFGKR